MLGLSSMGVAERRAREKDELRRRILDAATDLFLEQGYASVSMRKIAERIEYAPSTIYLYFQDKTDLVASICQEAFTELNTRLQAILDLGHPPLESLRQSLLAYVQFGLDFPSHYTFVLCTPDQAFAESGQQSCEAVHGAGIESFQRMRDGIQLCMKNGDIRTADVETTAQSVWLQVHGLTSGLVVCNGFPFVDRQTLIHTTIDNVLAGLR